MRRFLPHPIRAPPSISVASRIHLLMTKRERSTSPTVDLESPAMKKSRDDAKFLPNKIATAENAARVDASPPVFLLEKAASSTSTNHAKGDCVVYWMRMEDMRVRDNRALHQASVQAHKDAVPLLVLFVFSPQDYAAHDRSARRIDFTLRNLEVIRTYLAKLNIPLYTVTHKPRTKIPEFIHGLLLQWKASHVFSNIEYEVDELRRDIALCHIAKKHGKVVCTSVHDKCVLPPGEVRTKDGKGYTVYSPFLRSWAPLVEKAPSHSLGDASLPKGNDSDVHNHPIFGQMFKVEVPREVDGFSLPSDDRDRISTFWPAGEDAAYEMLRRFLVTASRSSQFGAVDPLTPGTKDVDPTKQSRLGKYKDARDRMDADTTSRLSPYLSAGIISVRACIREALKASGKTKLDVSRDTGVGRWIQELAWRDFYTHIIALFPRVSMGRPFLEKYANVRWETNPEHLQAWKEGKTGVPIVDAAMRQANTMGWMHNRARMIAAMFLVKDLMIDWRLGEQYFMETLIDGDLASNNGGWQWSASTGVDPAPYFRIFNPYTQSLKTDPGGEYIRHFVPELAKVRGAEVHNPPAGLADKLGYPRPLVDHKEARNRAIHRYKNIGSE